MRRTFTALLAVLAFSLPPSVHAATRPWIDAGGSWCAFEMKDVNSDIENLNVTVLSPSGLTMEHIKSGFAFDASLGMDIPPKLSITLGYSRFFASSEVGDPTGSLKYDLPANAFRATAQYAFRGTDASGFFAGAGAGLVSSAGSITVSATGAGSISSEIKGSGPLFEGFLGWNGVLSPIFGVTASAGYRYARIPEIKMNGQTVYLTDGQKESVDYSGIYFRAALRLYLTK